MTARTIRLTIAALGGQGGGVLTDWLIAIAEANDYIVQSTSVPGVAQRTGATIYYLEFYPRAEAEHHGGEPVMALMPVAGDVDCVVASELAEAGRAIARGLVTPERTTLISSTHRSYAIGEKSALGQGITDPQQLLELVRTQGKRSILFDMEQTAERHHSLISAVLLGAISGAGVLPFPKASFVEAVTRSGLAVATNLAAFEDAHLQAASGGMQGDTQRSAGLRPLPESARTAALQPLLDRVRRLSLAVQPLVLEGVRRTLDYQDRAYAALYLERIERIARLDMQQLAPGAGSLTEAVARSLALWMTFEDTIRVADLKTRSERFLLLRTVAGLRRWRRATWRFQQESTRIEAWLAAIERHAAARYALAVEIARSQRLLKGYGETHERGWRNFCALTQQLELLAARADGAVLLSRLQEAALADEEGTALAHEIASIAGSTSHSPEAGRARAAGRPA